MQNIALITEDELSEAVGMRILRALTPERHIDPVVRKGGFGYLKSRMKDWSELANYQLVLLLTDLDRIRCPVDLVNQWFGKLRRNDNFVFRVAVREMESWLLADHVAMRGLFGANCKLPEDPDSLEDPKCHLLALAKRANRKVRDELVAEEGSVAAQGIAYNQRLGEFVRVDWCPFRAAERSPSLRRAIHHISTISGR